MVYTSETACDDSGNWTVNFKSSLESADIFFSVDFEGQNWIQRVGSCMEAVETSVYFGPSQQLSSLIRLGGLAIGQLSPVERAAVKVGLWPKASESFKVRLRKYSFFSCLCRSHSKFFFNVFLDIFS